MASRKRKRTETTTSEEQKKSQVCVVLIAKDLASRAVALLHPRGFFVNKS